jgi:MFS family permease
VKGRRLWEALGEREFRLLWLGQTTSVLGDALVPVALAFAVLDDLDGSATDLGFVLGAQTATFVAFVLIGGVWADRLPRQLVMLSSDAIRCLVQATIAILLLSGSAQLWQLVALAATYGFADAFFFPAATGLIPLTVSPSRLQQANALLGMSRSAAFFAGPALAGVVVAVAQPGVAFVADAATFLVSIASLSALRLPRGERPPQKSFVADLSAGWRGFSSRKWLWVIVLWATTILFVVVAPMQVLGPIVAKEHLGGAGPWGAVLACWSAGSLLGGLLALRWKPARPLFVSAALLIVFAGPSALLAIPAPTAAIAAAQLAAGLTIGFFSAVWSTTMQQHIPSDTLSRVSAYDWMGSFAFLPLGFVLAGPVSHAIGIRTTLLAGAVWTVVSACLVLLVRDIRELRRRDDERLEPDARLEPGVAPSES